MYTVWAVSLRLAASYIVRPTLLMGGPSRSAVHIAAVAPGTSSLLDVCWVIAMSKVGGAAFSSSQKDRFARRRSSGLRR